MSIDKPDDEQVSALKRALEKRAAVAEWLLGEGQGEAAIAGLRRSLPCHCPDCMFRALIALAGVVAQHMDRAGLPELIGETPAVIALYASVARNPLNDRYFDLCKRPAELAPVDVFASAVPLGAAAQAGPVS